MKTLLAASIAANIFLSAPAQAQEMSRDDMAIKVGAIAMCQVVAASQALYASEVGHERDNERWMGRFRGLEQSGRYMIELMSGVYPTQGQWRKAYYDDAVDDFVGLSEDQKLDIANLCDSNFRTADRFCLQFGCPK